TLLLARVSSQVALALERLEEAAVHAREAASDAHAGRARLAGGAAAGERQEDIELALGADRLERGQGREAIGLALEVLLERALLVDDELAGAVRLHAHAGDGRLATADGGVEGRDLALEDDRARSGRGSRGGRLDGDGRRGSVGRGSLG